MADLQASIIQFCADIGQDPLLVQGAGGNVSWKENDTLWVKASGTWLGDAATNDIFVPVDLDELRRAIRNRNFSIKPTVVDNSPLKPSIETLLHALMPHRVVVHLHSIDILAYLVRRDCEHELTVLLGNKLPWALVDYFKPGAELAIAVQEALHNRADATAIFLKNHGVVIGGEDVNAIQQTLNSIVAVLRSQTHLSATAQTAHLKLEEYPAIEGYVPVDDKPLHRLAIDSRLYQRLHADWVLYPDHAVFLGARTHLYNSFAELTSAIALADKSPDLVFVRGQGVFIAATFNQSQAAQLRCYYDVLERIPPDVVLSPLSQQDIADLLARNDEQHRISIAKK